MESNIDRRGLERRKIGSLYKALFEITQEIILVIDANLDNPKILDVNSKALEMFGYDFDEITCLSLFDLSTDDVLTKDTLSECILNEPLSGNIRNYKKKDGSTVLIKVSVTKFQYDGKELILIVISDVTERKIASEALAESEAKYRAIVEDQIELICRFTPEGILTFANKAYCDYFAKQYEDIIGTQIMDLISEDNRNKVLESLKSMSVEKPYNHYDHKLIFPDGKIKWVHWSDRAIFDNNRRIKEFQSIGFDITDRKCLEEKLLKSKTKYKAILDTLHEGYFRTDSNGIVNFISQSGLELLGYYDRNEVLGQSIGEFLKNPNEREIFHQRLSDAGGRLYDQEIEIVNKNEEIMIISLNAQSILDELGHYCGAQGTFKDITEAKVRLAEVIKLYQVVEGSQTALMIIENDGTVSYANNAVLKVSNSPEWVNVQEHVVGRKAKAFLSVDDPLTLNEICRIVNQTGKWSGEAYMFCACSDKERVPIDVVFSKIEDNGNSYIVASFYGISERIAMEKKIREQSRLYEDLSNEMNTLVTKMDQFNSKKLKNISSLEAQLSQSAVIISNIEGGATNALSTESYAQ